MKLLSKHKALLSFIAAGLVGCVLFHLLKNDVNLMTLWTERATTPFKQLLAQLCSFAPFSVAELEVYAFALLVVFLVAAAIVRPIKKRSASASVKPLLSLVCVAVWTYFLMCALWGCNYYAASFSQKSGIAASEYTLEQLYGTTKLFAQKLGGVSESVPRNEDGVSDFSVEEILSQSPQVFDALEKDYPFLDGRDLKTKRFTLSKVMSALETSGVTFPFTGETNINADSPVCLIPSACAHETAHQRGVASEQEANFLAVLACESSGIAEYEYSGYLLAYIHLSNALYREDRELYNEIRELLPDGVKADLAFHSAYWKRYETKLSEKTNELYDDFLKGYDQPLGSKSYGAVADLLIEYYGQAR